jgi:diguanylate cyclase (GGDEF)-like protein
VARAQRSGGDLSLVLIDIDHFKRVNDRLGHPAGDEVLVSFAQRLLGVARSSDRVFRYGGEEFVLLLGDTDESGALALAQRAVDVISSRPMTASQQSLSLTCSAGVAELVSSDVSSDAVLRRADGALYDAKRQGRNRVIVASRPQGALDRQRIGGMAGESLEGTC